MKGALVRYATSLSMSSFTRLSETPSTLATARAATSSAWRSVRRAILRHLRCSSAILVLRSSTTSSQYRAAETDSPQPASAQRKPPPV